MLRIALAAGMLPESPDSALNTRLLDVGRRLADELVDAIGDGVLLHPAHPRVAPRHGRTVGRLWLITPAAVFNLTGVPVTQVPLGLSAGGLPLGVQVAAGIDNDHVSIAVALGAAAELAPGAARRRFAPGHTTGTCFQVPADPQGHAHGRVERDLRENGLRGLKHGTEARVALGRSRGWSSPRSCHTCVSPPPGA